MAFVARRETSLFRAAFRKRMTGARGAASAAVVYVGLALVGRFSSFLMLPLVARTVSLSEYGEIALAVTVSAFLSTILGLGLETPTTRASLGLYGEWSALRLRVLLLASRAFSLLFAALFAVTLWFSGASILQVRPSVLAPAAVAAALGASTHAVVLPGLRARRRLASFAMVAGSVVAVSVFGRLFALLALDAGPHGWFVAELCAQGLGFVVGLGAWRPPREQSSAAMLKHPSWSSTFDEAKAALRIGLPLVPHALAHWALNLGDRALVAAYLTLEEVATYTVAYQFASLALLLASEANRSLMPLYARAAQDPRRALRAIAQRQVAGTGAGFIVLALGIVALGPHVLPGSYSVALRFVPALLAGLFSFALYYVPANVLTLSKGNTGRIWQASVAALVVNMGTDIVLLPTLRAWGAVVGTIAGYTTLLGAVVVLERRAGTPMLDWALSGAWRVRFALASAGTIACFGSLTLQSLPITVRVLSSLAAGAGWFLVLEPSHWRMTITSATPTDRLDVPVGEPEGTKLSEP